ncbi:hypothetical protein [Halopelagius fulvigenes]|uniref:Halocin C8 n=1 Tax=Halopelagius fulvigenes TaxID=1198324 RepID=A0ABD5TXY7_9EURY
MATASLSISVLGSTTAVGTDSDGNNWEFEQLKGDEREKAIAQFNENPQVRELLRFARKQEWQPNMGEARAVKTVGPDVEKVSVTVGFETSANREENVFMGWESSADLETTLYYYSSEFDNDGKKYTQTVYTVNDSGEIVSESKDVTDVLNSVTSVSGDGVVKKASEEENGISIAASDGCYRECRSYVCDSYNLECIGQLVFMGVISLGTCLGCGTIDITKASCLVCFGSLGTTSLSPFTCHLGDNCSTRYVCVTRSQYRHSRYNDTGCRAP